MATALPAASVVNIAAYKFVELTDLQQLRDRLRSRCKLAQLRGTILLSPEGINMFLAGSREGIDSLLSEVRSLPGLADIEVKESLSLEQPFNRMLVKLKREIIAFGVDGIAPAQRTSPKLSARELKRWLDEGRPVRLLDTRNDYEVDLGTFRGAERLNIQHFREFPDASAGLPEQAKHEPLVMFCTGGIRCEKAGPMLERLGFQQVYQLDGGILKYFEECGGAHYDGGCFVFDSRVVLGPDLQPSGAVLCYNCQAVLTHEDIQSAKFRFGKSCPHCYLTVDQEREVARRRREELIRALAAAQPGSQPYENRRRMHVAARWTGWSLIDFLCAYHPPTSRDQWLAWIADGTITSSGQRVAAEQTVREGQRFDQVQSDYVEPTVSSDIGLIYEDEALVVINKPAPLPVHASGRYHRNTLEYILAQAYRPEKLRLAHRLDANTTGLVVLARKYSAARQLQPQFASGAVRKKYLLKVHGTPVSEQFECCEPVSAEPGWQGSRELSATGREATTQFRVLERCADGYWLLEAQPYSGRTHQIRLHAWRQGVPIVGDRLYRPSAVPGDVPSGVLGETEPISDEQFTSELEGEESGSWECAEPMCLHALELEFEHPFTGERLTFRAPAPAWR